jgi:nucleotide-binding universal stress UspA family protein
MVDQALECPLTRGERILVAVDGSKYSEKALDQAISMARQCNSMLFAISVIDMFTESLALAPALEEKLSKEARELLERVKTKVEKEDIPCETIVRTGGHPHAYIIEEAKARDIDLIVMGTHGRTGLKSVLMGSVTERVIGHAPCAVLVTPA